MITYQEEKLKDALPEMATLFQEYWDEIMSFKKNIVHDFSSEVYLTLEEQGKLHLTTARYGKKLVGYYMSIITPHTHYLDTIISECDLVFLKKEYRKGFAGYRLIKYTVDKLKQKVDLIHLSITSKRNFSPLIERLGFKFIEYRYRLEV